jgi:hypothetical protein
MPMSLTTELMEDAWVVAAVASLRAIRVGRRSPELVVGGVRLVRRFERCPSGPTFLTLTRECRDRLADAGALPWEQP